MTQDELERLEREIETNTGQDVLVCEDCGRINRKQDALNLIKHIRNLETMVQGQKAIADSLRKENDALRARHELLMGVILRAANEIDNGADVRWVKGLLLGAYEGMQEMMKGEKHD